MDLRFSIWDLSFVFQVSSFGFRVSDFPNEHGARNPSDAGTGSRKRRAGAAGRCSCFRSSCTGSRLVSCSFRPSSSGAARRCSAFRVRAGAKTRVHVICGFRLESSRAWRAPPKPTSFPTEIAARRAVRPSSAPMETGCRILRGTHRCRRSLGAPRRQPPRHPCRRAAPATPPAPPAANKEERPAPDGRPPAGSGGSGQLRLPLSSPGEAIQQSLEAAARGRASRARARPWRFPHPVSESRPELLDGRAPHPLRHPRRGLRPLPGKGRVRTCGATGTR